MWEYPDWNVPRLGGGMVIAAIATIHVLVAHFSVGAGFLLAIGEGRARKTQDAVLLDFLRLFSKVLLLAGFVFGAITGVGIWFSISIASTRATSMLIHTFVWFWAMEWVFFLVEIVAGYAYYTTWDKVPGTVHRALGWTYAAAAWMSLFLISGILSFMLTPGEWTETRDVWDAFLNPTFPPTVALRTVSCLAIAGLVAMLVANLSRSLDREGKTRVINFSAWFLSPLVLMLPFAAWYFAELPQLAKDLITGGAVAMMMFFLFGIVASTLVGLYAYFGLIRARRYINLETSLLLLSIAMIATVSMEFVREGVRKPYLIYDHLYSNGLVKSEIEKVNREGVLPNAPWATLATRAEAGGGPRTGEILFNLQCSQCHVLGGFNDLVPLIRPWSRELLVYNLDRIHELKPFMPPLVGTPEERRALADTLWELKEGSGDRGEEAAGNDQPGSGS
ncbi:MAG: cytochrome ubiquinol oxidase subunit I [Candidatus Omnitrophica bacterium]|nr:hypothetical protein [bacterium]NUN94733.1 cytochrome ubiquinol oxidase subunit I [Candidatus Omnitrophota bacterium]